MRVKPKTLNPFFFLELQISLKVTGQLHTLTVMVSSKSGLSLMWLLSLDGTASETGLSLSKSNSIGNPEETAYVV